MSASLIILSSLGVIGLLSAGVIANGYVLSVLWGWFMVPTFGLPPLGVAASIGLAMTMSYLTYQPTHDPRPALEAFGEGLCRLVVKPLFALVIGWIIKGFM